MLLLSTSNHPPVPTYLLGKAAEEMPSIIERLRKRTLSSQSETSRSGPSVPVSPQLLPPPSYPSLPPSRSEPSLVDRRIVEDLPALLGALERDGDTPGALKPPRPRKRSGLASFALMRKEDTPLAQDHHRDSSEKENVRSPSLRRQAGPSTWKGVGRMSQRNTGTTTSPWSTFGRHRSRSRIAHHGTLPPSAHESFVGPSVACSSSSGDGPLWSSSNLASTSSIEARVAESGESSSHTFGGQRQPDDRAASPPLATLRPPQEMRMHVSSQLDTLPATTPPLDSSHPSESASESRSDPPVSNASNNFHPPQQCPVDSNRPEFYTPLAEQHTANVSPDPAWSRQVHAEAPSGPGGDGLLSAAAEPHAQHASRSRTRGPCSPSPLIPLPSPFPTSPTLLDAENRSDGVTDHLSRDSFKSDFTEREGDSWMAEPRDATNTLNRNDTGTRESLKRGSSTASRAGTHVRARSRRSSQLSEPSTPTASTSKENGGAGPSSYAVFPTTPGTPTPIRAPRTPRTASEPGLRSVSEKSVLETPVNNKGKRKAEEVDITPPDQRAGHHATFVLPEGGHRSHHPSEVSRAPSSFNGRKRARLSTVSPSASPSQSRPASVSRHPTDSWPSRSAVPSALHRAASKTTSMGSHTRPESLVAAAHRNSHRRRSMSEISIPISALVAPHAPSISVRSSVYHMRDPRKPPRIHPTPWHLQLRTPDQDGSPIHAWFFFLGFVLFPLWYVASFWRIPKTRQVGGTDTEKAVTLDDPQVEHDARSWRRRCRIMSVVSLLTYVPFIVLVAIFVPRS